MTQLRGGQLIVWWRTLQEVQPLLKGYVRLARAEVALASGSTKGLAVALGLASVGLVCVLVAVVTGLVIELRDHGWAVWAAVAWIAVPAAILAAISASLVAVRYERCTLPQTRKRVRFLMELIDE